MSPWGSVSLQEAGALAERNLGLFLCYDDLGLLLQPSSGPRTQGCHMVFPVTWDVNVLLSQLQLRCVGSTYRA